MHVRRKKPLHAYDCIIGCYQLNASIVRFIFPSRGFVSNSMNRTRCIRRRNKIHTRTQAHTHTLTFIHLNCIRLIRFFWRFVVISLFFRSAHFVMEIYSYGKSIINETNNKKKAEEYTNKKGRTEGRKSSKSWSYCNTNYGHIVENLSLFLIHLDGLNRLYSNVCVLGKLVCFFPLLCIYLSSNVRKILTCGLSFLYLSFTRTLFLSIYLSDGSHTNVWLLVVAFIHFLFGFWL